MFDSALLTTRRRSISLIVFGICLFIGVTFITLINSSTVNEESISLIIIYQTNLIDSDLLTEDDRNLIIESVNEQLDLVDLYVVTSQFVSLTTDGNRKKREIPTELKTCEHGNSETVEDLVIVKLSKKHPTIMSDEHRSTYQQLRVSPRLTNGQRVNIRMSLCSIQPMHNESSDKKVTYGPCQGGFYPNDGQCFAYQYGPDPIQVIDCHLPKGPSVPLMVLLIHGGFWRSRYNRSIEDAIGNDLLRFNIIVCNLDYRSFGNGGGCPNTFVDVATGADLLRVMGREHGFQSDRVIVVGHSAGGQLGGYLTGRFRLKPDQPGYSPNPLRPIALVTQAGVNNMWDGCDQAEETGSGAVIDFLGGTYDMYPERYTLSSVAASSNATVRTRYPSQFLPLGVPIQTITGSADITVPVSQTVTFAEQAKNAGDNCTQVIVDGEDHFVHLNISSRSWNKTLTFILSFIP